MIHFNSCIQSIAINICNNNDLNLSQDLDDGDDYINTADLNVYGNIWKKEVNFWSETSVCMQSKQTTK